MEESRQIPNQGRAGNSRGNINKSKLVDERIITRKKEKAFSESFVAMSRLGNEGNYSTAYDMADKLIGGITEDNDFEDSKRNLVMNKVTSMLEEQYRDAIISKYNSLFNEVYEYGSQEEYVASGYPGSYEEFARTRAIDKLTSQLAKSRYGGYMHSIINKVLREYFSEQRAISAQTCSALSKSIPREPLVPKKIRRTTFNPELEAR